MSSTISYDELHRQARTGDLLLFHSSEFTREIVEIGTGGKYSHVAMLIRPDATSEPLIWQESGIPVSLDPDTNTTHDGAQLGELGPALVKILALHDHPTYRPLAYARTPEFEAKVQEIIRECEGRPFPSVLDMAERWIEGHFFHEPSTEDEMFCSQLVALTYQSTQLLGLHEPPNFYSPNSFSTGNDDAKFLQGASLGEEVFVDTDTLPPAPPTTH